MPRPAIYRGRCADGMVDASPITADQPKAGLREQGTDRARRTLFGRAGPDRADDGDRSARRHGHGPLCSGDRLTRHRRRSIMPKSSPARILSGTPPMPWSPQPIAGSIPRRRSTPCACGSAVLPVSDSAQRITTMRIASSRTRVSSRCTAMRSRRRISCSISS